MNWFRNDPPEMWEKDNRCDRCEHVENGVSAVVAAGEFDSFGPVEVTLMCRECFDRMREEEENRLVFCHDCKTKKPKKECCRWTWWDFYAAQGDEPLTICNDCWSKPKHVARMEADQASHREAADYGEDEYTRDLFQDDDWEDSGDEDEPEEK